MASYLKTLFVISFIAVCLAVYSQEEWVVTGGSNFSIVGTSTLHDWSASSDEVTGEGLISSNNGIIDSIEGFKIMLPVETLKSDKASLDKNMYKALGSDRYKSITFRLEEANVLNHHEVEVLGSLFISGELRQIKEVLNYTKDSSGFVFTGSKKLDMTEWGIQPPVLFFGTLKTGKVVTVDYRLICAPK